MDGVIRISDKHLLLVAHSNDNNSGDDLLTWDLTVNSIASPTITAKTNIFTDQGSSAQVAMVINQQNDDVYVAYLKGGSWLSLVDVVFHKSTNGMSSWGSELPYSQTTDDYRILHGGRTISNSGGKIQWVFYDDDDFGILVNLVNDVPIGLSGFVPPGVPGSFGSFGHTEEEVGRVPNLKVTIQVEIGGVPIAGFPVVKRLVVDESQQFNYEKAADGNPSSFSALPVAELATVEALIIKASDLPITVRLDGQSDSGIELKLGGILVILDATIDAGAGVQNVSINNPASSDLTLVSGVAAGT
ncbi:hypothetical protein IIA15_09610 [candidate division TA06 bacterium]|nr:hypothetical protein [candidate division TA06 bacterium]